MMHVIEKIANRLMRPLGYAVIKRSDLLSEFDDWIQQIIRRVSPYTMTSPERIAAVCLATDYLVSNSVPGAIVECGVWRGGSTMAAALTLARCGDVARELFLYDTFQGMTPPTERDRDRHRGLSAREMAEVSLELHRSGARPTKGSAYWSQDINGEWRWCASSLDEVKGNIASVGYPMDLTRFVEGPVEATIPKVAPSEIALLRLDTDWYESTRHEMEHLFPRLVKGGVLIIDDYGQWEGARQAVDEYLKRNGIALLLNRIDYTGRVGVKL